METVNVTKVKELLRQSADSTPDRVTRFFKQKPGSYAEHDKFMGVMVPVLRKIAREFCNLSLGELQELLSSDFNEERLLVLLILTMKYPKAPEQTKQEIYDFYLKNLKYVNNWNLVDSSARQIIGEHLIGRDRSWLIKLARSRILWERRIAIVATWQFIRQGDLSWTFRIAQILLGDKEDLIHKAVGWMLHEAGRKDLRTLLAFIEANLPRLPRTTLRCAIQDFSPEQRKFYLKR